MKQSFEVHKNHERRMADEWEMEEGGLIIELFKTTGASMKFDRMIPS